ncbi:LysM peptidoglycan-binding domain-containing protein [Arthrobacter sp. NPDC058288]|uniref:LysM peptidoglycan-binding domain-containing protein n=1 Tax=Arthrobacter sp. NPDC058288 TaxID=3346424 RepID=UPI0036E27BD9
MVVPRVRFLGSDAALAAAILLLGLCLAATGASLMARWQRSSAKAQSLGFEDLLGLAVNTAGLIVVTWWVLSMLSALVSAVLERAGNNRAAAITGKFSPAFMRRLALAAVGIQLLAAPLAHAAADPADPRWSPTSNPAAAAVSMDTGQAAQGQLPVPPPTPRSSPTASSAGGLEDRATFVSGLPAGSTSLEDLDPGWKPDAPHVAPGPLAAQPVRSARQPVEDGGHVTVLAGDSLWSIAARQLGGSQASDLDVAREWPRWYEANRAVIGDNPNVLLPGQILRPPAAS